MKMSARITSRYQHHTIEVQTEGIAQALTIPPKPAGFGSAVNGAELLLLALATCFCNDIYREAARRQLVVTSVEVEASGEFGAAGEIGSNFTYRATVQAEATAEEIDELIRYTDSIAEVHNTLRRGIAVTLTNSTSVL